MAGTATIIAVCHRNLGPLWTSLAVYPILIVRLVIDVFEDLKMATLIIITEAQLR